MIDSGKMVVFEVFVFVSVKLGSDFGYEGGSWG